MITLLSMNLHVKSNNDDGHWSLTDFEQSCNISPKRSVKSVKNGLLLGSVSQQCDIMLYLNINTHNVSDMLILK